MTQDSKMPDEIWAFSTGETDHPEFWAGGCTNSESYMSQKSEKYIRKDRVDDLVEALEEIIHAAGEALDIHRNGAKDHLVAPYVITEAKEALEKWRPK